MSKNSACGWSYSFSLPPAILYIFIQSNFSGKISALHFVPFTHCTRKEGNIEFSTFWNKRISHIQGSITNVLLVKNARTS